ncbi:MAG: hypothetical protein NUV46_01110 [Nanoarchaeota archaeon]|nr:hypothetical protein [Nanoarchaeota archaeon]
MVLKSRENSIGAWVFLIGIVIAILIGIITAFVLPWAKLIQYSSPLYGILVILGLIIGFNINVSEKDAQTFLVVGAVLVIVSRFGMESVTGSLIGIGLGDAVASTFSALLTLFVPATIIVAIKTVFSITRI